jgi:hypothetical protein
MYKRALQGVCLVVAVVTGIHAETMPPEPLSVFERMIRSTLGTRGTGVCTQGRFRLMSWMAGAELRFRVDPTSN